MLYMAYDITRILKEGGKVDYRYEIHTVFKMHR